MGIHVLRKKGRSSCSLTRESLADGEEDKGAGIEKGIWSFGLGQVVWAEVRGMKIKGTM